MNQTYRCATSILFKFGYLKTINSNIVMHYKINSFCLNTVKNKIGSNFFYTIIKLI